MSLLRRALAMALVAALCAPFAVAGSADGHFEWSGEVTLEDVTLTAPRADFVYDARGTAPTLRATADEVIVERIGASYLVVPGVSLGQKKIEETARHTHARVSIEAGLEGLLVLRALGPIEASATAASLSPIQSGLLFGDPVDHPSRCPPAARLCADAFGVHEATTTDLDATFSGDVVLWLLGPTFLVTDASGETRYASGTHQTQGPPREQADTIVVVRLKGAAGSIAAQEPLRVYAHAPSFTATAVHADAAQGSLAMDGRVFRARGDAFELRGTLLIEPAPVAPVGAYRPDEILRADAMRAEVRGDVSALSLQSTPLIVEAPQEAIGIVVLVVFLSGMIAWAWPLIQFHGTAAVLPLFTRLKAPLILDNEIRKSIFEIVRNDPGISARSVHRRTAQSWGTVVYHLRQLEQHDLLVSRRIGRQRAYYENHGRFRGVEVQIACLRGPRALALARCIIDRPGIAQEDLSGASGLAQPMTSYHVRKLLKAGLVDARREGRYVRYFPMDELIRMVSPADVSQAGTVLQA